MGKKKAYGNKHTLAIPYIVHKISYMNTRRHKGMKRGFKKGIKRKKEGRGFHHIHVHPQPKPKQRFMSIQLNSITHLYLYFDENNNNFLQISSRQNNK